MTQRPLLPASKPRLRVIDHHWVCQSPEAFGRSWHRHIAYCIWAARAKGKGFIVPKEN